jgi:hypothetical protein
MYTQNLINENFNELLKPFEISGEQYNVLRILRGQKRNPANMSKDSRTNDSLTSNTTRLTNYLKSMSPENTENRRK